MIAKIGFATGFLTMCALAQHPLGLDDFERMALASSPALKQANLSVRAAQGTARQSGLYPNPVVGVTGDQAAPGQIGEYGGFIEQRVVLGGKLSKSRLAAEQSSLEAKARAEAERYRVLNAVRRLFYRALGDEKLIEVGTSMAALAAESVQFSSQLANVGLADKPDLLSAKVEAQRVALSLVAAHDARDRTWRELAAAVGNPDLKPGPLAGDLTALPALDADAALARILKESPALAEAKSEAAQAALMLRRAEAEKIPDLQLRGGVRYNREMLDGLVAANRLSTVGVEGFFDIGVDLPLFNRNQGGIETATAEAESAQLLAAKETLDIRRRFAQVFQEYRDSSAAAASYRSEMIPAAREAYDLYLKNYHAMAGPYSQVLMAQRSLFELEEQSVTQLVAAWQAAVEIEGFLY